MNYEMWKNDGMTSDQLEQKSWNVLAAEADIGTIHQLARMQRKPEVWSILESQLAVAFGEKFVPMKAAAAELLDILSNKDTMCGYHLNHILSGKNVFSLFHNNGSVDMPVGEPFDDKNEADAFAATIVGASVEEIPSEDGTVQYQGYEIDADATAEMRQNHVGGDYIADFDTKEEADAEGAAFDSYYLMENPSDEWWVVVNNQTGKAVYTMLFPTERRALAFLYRIAKPDAWMKYVEFVHEQEMMKHV